MSGSMKLWSLRVMRLFKYLSRIPSRAHLLLVTERGTTRFVSRFDDGAVTVWRADSTTWHTSGVHPDQDPFRWFTLIIAFCVTLETKTF